MGELSHAVVVAAQPTSAQHAELQCALLGAERAPACMRSVAARSARERDIERAATLLVRSGSVRDAEQAVEQAFARGPDSALWNAVFIVAHAHEARAAHEESLRWHRAWIDRAKRHARADVLAAARVGEGRALLALGHRALAYDAWRLAVHVWRGEHAYKLSDGGEVLNERDGTPGYVAPELWTTPQLIDAQRAARADADSDAVDRCDRTHTHNLRAYARCLRSAPPEPPEFRGLTDRTWYPVSPFGGLVHARATRVHRTRSALDDAAFARGNRAVGEAWLGMLRVTLDESYVESAAFQGTDDAAWDAWSRSTFAPHIRARRYLLSHRALLFAREAIATGVAEVELEAAPRVAAAFAAIAHTLRTAPPPPGWLPAHLR
jgi:hypothetical protein